jgi:magnesium-transporting ATPase (P-type)
MQAISSLTLRNGEWKEIDAKLLVPGDVVRVRVGDRVPADCRLIKLNSVSLKIEEAPLTGESVSVDKIISPMQGSGQMLQDQRNMIFSSTVVTYGNAEGVVVFTGMKTAIGRVQEDVANAGQDEEATPLKKKLDDFGDKLSILIGLICFLVWIMNYNKFYDEIHGTPIKGCIYYFKIAIALAVAAIPEGLPAVITTCLALGTRKMARNNCIVRRLPSVQTLGCTTVICSDKTGTLTKNEMCAVELAYVGESIKDMKTFKIEENSYDPNAKVVGLTKDHLKDRSPLLEMAYVCSLNSTAKVVKDAGKFKRQGEPTEAALIVGSEKIGQIHSGTNFNSAPMPFHDQLSAKVEKIGVLEFSSERKTMSTVIKGLNLNSKGGNSVLLKGAPERVIEKCTTYKT